MRCSAATRLPMTPGPIEPFPAGISPEDIGVIDPSLIGLRATPVQLPTPRASVTPQLSPLKLRSDSSVGSSLRNEVKPHSGKDDPASAAYTAADAVCAARHSQRLGYPRNTSGRGTRHTEHSTRSCRSPQLHRR